MQQVFGHASRRLFGEEQAQQPVRQRIAQHHQAAGQAQADHQPRAQNRADAFDAPCPNRLRTEDRRRDRNRQRRELHVIDDLRHRAIRRRRLGTVLVHQRQDHQLRQRQHHHLQPGRQADAQHLAEDRPVQLHRREKLPVRRQRMPPANQAPRQPAHRRQVTDQPGKRRTLNPHRRQPHPAANQRRRQRQPDTGRDHQRQQRRQGIAHPAQQLGEQHEHQQRRHEPQHHMGIRHRIVQHIRRRPQPHQRRPRKHTPHHCRDQTDQQAQQQGRPGDGLHQMLLPCAPGLPDQHPRPRAEADDQGDEEKHDGEHAGHGGQGLGAEHLANVNAVDGAGHGLKEIRQDHGGEKQEVGFPEGALGLGGGLHGVEVHLDGVRIDRDSFGELRARGNEHLRVGFGFLAWGAKGLRFRRRGSYKKLGMAHLPRGFHAVCSLRRHPNGDSGLAT